MVYDAFEDIVATNPACERAFGGGGVGGRCSPHFVYQRVCSRPQTHTLTPTHLTHRTHPPAHADASLRGTGLERGGALGEDIAEMASRYDLPVPQATEDGPGHTYARWVGGWVGWVGG